MTTALPEFVTRLSETSYEFRIWVQPGAHKTCLAGIHDHCLKLKLKAPPVDNKANKEMISSLSSLLGVRSRDILLKSGSKSRRKVVHISMDKEPDWKIFEV